MKNIYKLIISVLICLLAGFIGSFFTSVSGWYFELNKPWFNPPNWVFAPVWTLLYVLMGISLYLVWIKGIKNAKIGLSLFGIQLFLNALWSIIFFGLQAVLFAFIEIIVLWVFILLTIIWFYRISKSAAYLLTPYIVWVSFAAALNYWILLLN